MLDAVFFIEVTTDHDIAYGTFFGEFLDLGRGNTTLGQNDAVLDVGKIGIQTVFNVLEAGNQSVLFGGSCSADSDYREIGEQLAPFLNQLIREGLLIAP